MTFRHISPKCDMSATVPPLQCQCVCAGCYVAPDGGVILKQLTMASTVYRIQAPDTRQAGHSEVLPLLLSPVSMACYCLLLVACIYCFPSVLLSAAPGSEWSCTLGEISSWIVSETSAPLSTVQWLSGHSLDIIHTAVDVNTDTETQILTLILQIEVTSTLANSLIQCSMKMGIIQ